MYERQPPKEVENYTNAFLVSFGIVLFMFLLVLSVIAGLLTAIVTAFGLDRFFLSLRRGD